MKNVASNKVPTVTRSMLQEQLSTLQARIERIRAGYQSGRSADSEDRAQENAGNEVRDALEGSDLKEIELIKAALQRLDEGKYGVCVECEGAINAKRLQANPLATLCIECAQNQEG